MRKGLRRSGEAARVGRAGNLLWMPDVAVGNVSLVTDSITYKVGC